MRFKPVEKVPAWIQWPATAVLSPLLAAIVIGVAVEWLCEKIAEHKRDIFGPHRVWRAWFAWRPVRITCWADHGNTTVRPSGLSA